MKLSRYNKRYLITAEVWQSNIWKQQEYEFPVTNHYSNSPLQHIQAHLDPRLDKQLWNI